MRLLRKIAAVALAAVCAFWVISGVVLGGIVAVASMTRSHRVGESKAWLEDWWWAAETPFLIFPWMMLAYGMYKGAVCLWPPPSPMFGLADVRMEVSANDDANF